MGKYIVEGNFEGNSFSHIVDASSRKQAKLRVGFHVTGGGDNLKDFMSGSSIKVRASN